MKSFQRLGIKKIRYRKSLQINNYRFQFHYLRTEAKKLSSKQKETARVYKKLYGV
jgi:hypothetical protein